MAESRILKLNILAETKDLVSGLNKAQGATSSASDKIAKGFKIAAAAVAAAGAAAIAFGAKAIVAAEKAATANARIAQINESMGLFGNSVGQVNERLIAYAETTARATGIDQNSIKATQAKLLTFKELAASANEVGAEFDRATKAAIDLAAAGFGSAETNAVQLGKALQDPIKGLTALSRSGVTFTETEKERIKVLVESNKMGEAQALILEAIEKQVGGTAEATANASDKMKISFDLVTERIGLLLLPMFEKFAAILIDRVVPFIEQRVVPAFEILVRQFQENVAPALGVVIEALRDFLIPTFQALWTFLTEELIPLFAKIYEIIVPVLADAFDRLTKKVEENEESLKPLLETLKVLWEFISNTFIPLALKAVVINFNSAIRAVEIFIDALGLLMRTIKPILEALQTMARLLSEVGSFLFGGGGGGGGGGGSMPSVPSAPSVPQPLPPAGVMSTVASATGMGGSVTINVNGTVLDPEGTARAIQSVLVNSTSRAGALSLTPVLSI